MGRRIATENKMQLGQLVLEHGVVTQEQIENALAEQKEKLRPVFVKPSSPYYTLNPLSRKF